MVGFFIDLNGKTNHKLPVYGIRKGRKIRTQRKSTVPWISVPLKNRFVFRSAWQAREETPAHRSWLQSEC